MEPSLLSTLKTQLNPLQQSNLTVVEDLCQLAWELISKGVGGNVFNTVAQKLQVTRSVVEDAVEGISCLLFQIYSCQLTEEQFLEATEPLQLGSDALRVIYSAYVKHEDSLQVLRSIGVSSAQFSGIQWRLESELASRSRRSGLDPRVVLRLDLNKGGTPESVALVSDIPNIIRWSEMVEQALAESRTQNARRIHRAVS